MTQQTKEQLEFKYSKMPEIAYYVMLIVVVAIIIASSIGTFIIRKATGTEIILIPDNIYKFIIDVLSIFVLPISVKIGGEVFVQALNIWRGNPYSTTEANPRVPDFTQAEYQTNYHTPEHNPTEIQTEFEKIYKERRKKT